MPTLGQKSKERLNTVYPRLKGNIEEAIKVTDFTVLCGVRSKEEQEAAEKAGNSKVKWPESKHNLKPGRNDQFSLAVDVAPYPIDWNDLKRFYFLAGVIMSIAAQRGVKLRWGGDFNRDYNFSNDKFVDMPHFEIDE